MTIGINALAYSPVEDGLEENDEDLWQVSTRNMSVDQEIIDIFREYLADIIAKPDTNQVSIGKFQDGVRTEEYLDELVDLDLEIDEDSDDYDQFEDVAQSFAVCLINHMDGSTSSGVLFTALFRRSRNHVSATLELVSSSYSSD